MLAGRSTGGERSRRGDIATGTLSAPQLQHSAFGMAMDTIDADSLLIEAYVDANGRGRITGFFLKPDSRKTFCCK